MTCFDNGQGNANGNAFAWLCQIQYMSFYIKHHLSLHQISSQSYHVISLHTTSAHR